jgi:RNA polymerase sigma-70 factor, ECF subfamily
MAAGPATLSAQERPLLAAARGGDEAAFGRLVDPYRGELHAHCYRMLGSVHDAEDALQDALLRAWRALAKFEGRSSLRSWLYTIATNTSLNLIGRRPKRVLPIDYAPAADPHGGPGLPVAESVWMEPYADDKFGLQDGLAGPEARFEQRESVELAFIAALQHLPPNQRAVLILRDVLGFSAKETAETLETTVASANSALQRARATVEERLPDQSQQATLRALGDERLNEIVERYMEAWEACDVDGVVGMLTEDASFSMPPLATWFGPRDAIETFLVGSPMSGDWRWKAVRVRANGQEALAFYNWDAEEEAFVPFALNVLTFRGEQISDVTAFIIRTPPETDDRELILRMPERDASPLSLEAAFQNFGVPDRLN